MYIQTNFVCAPTSNHSLDGTIYGNDVHFKNICIYLNVTICGKVMGIFIHIRGHAHSTYAEKDEF